IGMENYPFTELHQLRDPIGGWYFRDAVDILGFDVDTALERALRFSRARCRTPMQWTAAPQAGFTDGQPWLPVHPNHREGISVAAQRHDPGSLLTWYRTLMALRRSHPAIAIGDYRPLSTEAEPVLVFERLTDTDRVVVAVNFTAASHDVDEPDGLTATIGAGERIAPYDVRVWTT
ncbi:MAG: DUF3459 domain-containing protein, partial [Acidimicrobiia bacterium]|nr:DUF3459 domain-containing protein [Acidimicrobiia bacterium]